MQAGESEKLVEAHLVRRLHAIGGKAYKWVAPGNAGVPDRICLFPGGGIELVELKGAGGVLTPSQKKRFPELLRLGCRVWVLRSRNQVDRFLAFMGGDHDAVCAASLPGLLYRPPAD